MKEQINEQLALLEKELSRLKKVTDYIDNTKTSAQSVIAKLKIIQDNYTTYTTELFDLYKSSVEQIKKETELQIKEGVIHFETTGSQIDQTNREKLLETKRLLENYRKTVEATDNLVKTLEAVDFPVRLNKIEEQIIKTHKEVENRFNFQYKQSKSIKEATDNLVKILEAVDFTARLNKIEEQIIKTHKEVDNRFNLQDKENKSIKILLFVILGIVSICGIWCFFGLQ